MNGCPEGRRRLARVRQVLLLTSILLIGFALRAWLLGAQNVWWDEALAIWAVRKSWTDVTLWTASDVHPPIYFWLLKAWVTVAGESEYAARFVSLVSGLVTLAVSYPLGKVLFTRKTALLGMALVATGRFHVWWSQEMRMYIVATMWGVLSVYTMLRWFRAEGWTGSEECPPAARVAWAEVVLYVLATAAGMYTLYLFGTILLIQNLCALILLRRCPVERQWLPLFRWFGSQVAVLLLFAPWLALALPRMRSWSVAEPFEFRVFVQLFATLLPLGISTYVERYLWLVAPFFAVIAAGLIGLWSRRGLDHGPLRSRQKQSVSLLLLFLVVPLLVVYVLTRPRGLFYAPNVEARYLVLFAPAFYLLLAWAVLAVQRRSASIGGLVCVFVAIVFLSVLPGHYGGRYLRDELQTMARVVGTYAESGDAVVVVSGSRYPIFDYYWGRLSQMHVSPPVYFVPQQSLMVDDSNVAAELEPVAADHARIWLAEVNAPMEDPRGLVKSWLGERYAPALSYGFAHNALTLYAPAGELATVNAGNLAPQHEAAVELGGDTVLRGYDLPTSEFRPGDVVRLALYYSSLQGAELSIRLVDELGRVLAERRCHWPAVQPVGREQLDFTIFPNTPAGTYHLELGPEGAEPDAVPCFIHIRGTRTLPEVDEPIAAYAATLEGGIHLSGYSITDASGQAVRGIHPGQILTLDLFWYNEEKLSRDYTVFAHLVGQAYNPATAGPVWAGHDSQPADNGYPTTQWFVGETIVDRHVLTIDAGAPSGEYEVEVGMYLLETMQRLHFLDDQGGMVADRAVLDRFELVRSE